MDFIKQQEEELQRREAIHKELEKSSPFTGWKEHEIQTLRNTKDPSYRSLKQMTEDEKIRRKLSSLREKELFQEKQALSDLKLRIEFKERVSDKGFQAKLEDIMEKHDLKNSPHGRLVAARLLRIEEGQ